MWNLVQIFVWICCYRSKWYRWIIWYKYLYSKLDNFAKVSYFDSRDRSLIYSKRILLFLPLRKLRKNYLSLKLIYIRNIKKNIRKIGTVFNEHNLQPRPRLVPVEKKHSCSRARSIPWLFEFNSNDVSSSSAVGKRELSSLGRRQKDGGSADVRSTRKRLRDRESSKEPWSR